MNGIFDPYDLFSGTGKKKISNNIHILYPEITEMETEKIMNYLDGFWNYCVGYGQMIANKYKYPSIPHSKEAEEDENRYLEVCKKKYPDMTDDKIVGIFRTVCWLSNR